MKTQLVTLAHAAADQADAARKPIKIDPIRLAETRLLAQASAGGGKSYVIRKILELTHGYVQQLVIDPEGEFSSLRDKFDYVYIAKGEKTEPDPKTAEVLARSLLELEVSAIIDIYELHPRDRRKFVRHFIQSLVDAPKNLRHPTLVVLDEAHEYAPEQNESEALDAIVELASKGRKRKLACVLATQRPAKLNKDVAAECRNKLIGLANLDIDRKRGGDELGFRTKEQMLSLRNLDPGEFYVLGPAFQIGQDRVRDPVKVQVDDVVTPHGEKAERWRAPKTATSKQVKAALAALAKLPKQAEQELKDKEAALTRVRELEREIRELKKTKKEIPMQDLNAIAEKARRQAKAEAERELRAQLEALQRKLKGQLTSAERFALSVRRGVEQLARTVAEQFPDFKMPDLPKPKPISVEVRAPVFHPTEVSRAIRVAVKEATEGDKSFGLCARKMLNLLTMRGGEYVTKSQLAGWTHYRITSSTFRNGLAQLGGAGLIVRTGEKVALAPGREKEAIEILGSDYTPDADFSIDGWLEKLSKGPRTMLTYLRDNAGRVIPKEELAAAADYTVTSSTFRNAVAQLCSRKLALRTEGGLQINQEVLG